MNDIDYQSTLECLRIAARLIMPLDLDGFLQRVAALENHGGQDESLSLRRLARIAQAIRDEGGARRIATADPSGATPAQHSWPES
jgi:hypothetical protein